LPRSYARGELVWTATPTIKATMSATYIGNRRDDAVPEGRPLDAVTLFDAGVRWQSKRHNLEAALNVTNIFDDQVEVYNAFPRYGRAVVASIATHF
jgi:outer membrane receptor protein involved in Fe transport